MSIVGKQAPSFRAQAAHQGEIVDISLDDYRGQWVVFYFYPLDFTFVCPTEIVAFDDLYEQFKAANAEVIACSVDSAHTHLAWMRTPRSQGGIGEIKYALVSDLEKNIAAAWDVLDGGVAQRGAYIIDPDGVVQAAMINNEAVGRNVHEVLRLLKGFQHVREHGDKCPANWQEEESGMAASLQGVAGRISR